MSEPSDPDDARPEAAVQPDWQRAWDLVHDQRRRRANAQPPVLLGVCLAAAAYLDVAGAAITVAGEDGPHAVAAATDDDACRFAEMQFTAGEGPGLDAHRDARPVLVPDLARVARGRWPGYLSLALEAGLGAVFSLPLHVGAARFGVLDIFGHHPTPLDDEQIATLLALARIANESMLDVGGVPPGSLDQRAEVFQAQGMLMIALDIGLAEALVRMRAHAFAHRRSLSDLAREIVAGRTFAPDEI